MILLATLLGKMGLSCLLGIACFDPTQGKKLHGVNLQNLSFLDNVSNGVTKSSKRHTKQINHKQRCTITVAFSLTVPYIIQQKGNENIQTYQVEAAI